MSNFRRRAFFPESYYSDWEVGNSIPLIDTNDYRDIWAELPKPDPDEPKSNIELFYPKF